MFTFAPKHKLQACTPAPGLIEGTFNPGVSGPGDYALAFSVGGSGEVIAQDTVTSPDGGVVAVSIAHTASGDGTFQRNLSVSINGAPPGPPQPVCLASGE